MPDRPAGHEPEMLTIVEAGTGPRSFRLGHRVLYRAEDLRSWIDVQHGRVANDPGSRR